MRKLIQLGVLSAIVTVSSSVLAASPAQASATALESTCANSSCGVGDPICTYYRDCYCSMVAGKCTGEDACDWET